MNRSFLPYLGVLGVVGIAGSCGGSNGAGAGNFYSCNDVKKSTPSANGEVTETRFCQEYTFHYTDPTLLAQAVNGNGALCKAAPSSREVATWSPAPCPKDSSLISACDDPSNTTDMQRKLYHYYNTINGKPIVDPQLAGAYGCGAVDGGGANGTGGSSGTSGSGGTGGTGGMSGDGGATAPAGTCADLSTCCSVITNPTAKSTCMQLEANYQGMVGHGITQAQADNACATFLQLERSGLLCP